MTNSSPPSASQPEAAVLALQQAVIKALREGAELASVHKEGGTVIRHDGKSFVAADFGDNTGKRRLDTEALLLDYLWRHFEFENRRDAAPQALTPAIGWRMIHDRLTTGGSHGGSGPAGGPRGLRVFIWAAVIGTLALAAVLGYLKYSRKAQAVQAEPAPAVLHKVVPPPKIAQPPQRIQPPGAASGARP
jgi:hypothetical protein